ncbi:hypothetical protein [Mycoplasmopsis gallopavonis]|uniref:hypothetical protein n=1 Tax=Mycoplasmopsis gallopavonis TaxID=76629 RepID=UPI0013E9EE13|nr:hypothetical protein [Mycoplasmopsis gallopavonis]
MYSFFSSSQLGNAGDQLLAYIYYLEKPKDRHSSRTIVEVLLDALNKGYLKNPQ